MAEVAQPSMIGALIAPQLDADGRLADDLPCRRCGYSLRGLTRNGKCPECSTPVGRSIHGDLLEFSDPKWVMRIARGGSVLVASIFLVIVGTMMLVLLPRTVSLAAMSISMSIAKVVQIIGFWLVTERDPALAHREPPITARTLARYTSIIVAGLTIAVYLSGGQPSSSGRLHLPALAGASPAVRVSAQLLVAALSILSIAALLRYARTLALRLPDERIARQCAGVAIVLSITLGIAALLNAYFAITGTRPRGSFAGSPLSALRAMVSLATGLGMWWCMLLIFNFRRQLAQAAHRARESWARPLR